MIAELLQAAPLALLFSLPVAVGGGLVLLRLRRRSLTATMVALVLVPLVAALVGVLVLAWMAVALALAARRPWAVPDDRQRASGWGRMLGS